MKRVPPHRIGPTGHPTTSSDAACRRRWVTPDAAVAERRRRAGRRHLSIVQRQHVSWARLLNQLRLAHAVRTLEG